MDAVPHRPNIVYIKADDMGWGDVGCFNPESRIPTHTWIGWPSRAAGLRMPIPRLRCARRPAMGY